MSGQLWRLLYCALYFISNTFTFFRQTRWGSVPAFG